MPDTIMYLGDLACFEAGLRIVFVGRKRLISARGTPRTAASPILRLSTRDVPACGSLGSLGQAI